MPKTELVCQSYGLTKLRGKRERQKKRLSGSCAGVAAIFMGLFSSYTQKNFLSPSPFPSSPLCLQMIGPFLIIWKLHRGSSMCKREGEKSIFWGRPDRVARRNLRCEQAKGRRPKSAPNTHEQGDHTPLSSIAKELQAPFSFQLDL